MATGRHAGGRRGERQMLQAAAVLAVGTAAVALVAGLGTYLYVRFTQHRVPPPGGRKQPPSETKAQTAGK